MYLSPKCFVCSLFSLVCLALAGCGTSAYTAKIESSMKAAPKAPVADSTEPASGATAATANPQAGPSGGQVLGGNRQSFLGQPLNAANRLKAQEQASQIAKAIFQSELSGGGFPTQAITDGSGTPLLSWRVKLLRDLDPNMYRQFKIDEPWDSQHNLPLVDRMPDLYDVGYDLPSGHTAILALVGKDTIIRPGQRGSRSSGVTDGPSNTIMFVIGSSEAAVPWTQPVDINIDEPEPLKKVIGGDNTFMAAFADSRVVRVRNTDPSIVLPFFTKSGGEAVRLSDLEN